MPIDVRNSVEIRSFPPGTGPTDQNLVEGAQTGDIERIQQLKGALRLRRYWAEKSSRSNEEQKEMHGEMRLDQRRRLGILCASSILSIPEGRLTGDVGDPEIEIFSIIYGE